MEITDIVEVTLGVVMVEEAEAAVADLRNKLVMVVLVAVKLMVEHLLLVKQEPYLLDQEVMVVKVVMVVLTVVVEVVVVPLVVATPMFMVVREDLVSA